MDAPQPHPRDLVDAKQFATWFVHKHGFGDDVCPDPLRACRRAGLRIESRPRAEMTDTVRFEPRGKRGTIVLAEEVCRKPRDYYFDVAYLLAADFLRRGEIACKDADKFCLAWAATFLVPPEQLRPAWQQTSRRIEDVLLIWEPKVPHTAIVLRVGEDWHADAWIYEQSALRHARVRPSWMRPKPKHRNLVAKSLSDGIRRVAVLVAA